MSRPTCESVASQLGQNINKGPSFDHLLTVAQKFQKKTEEVCKLGVEGLMWFAWQTGEQKPPDGRLLNRSSVDKSVNYGKSIWQLCGGNKGWRGWLLSNRVSHVGS